MLQNVLWVTIYFALTKYMYVSVLSCLIFVVESLNMNSNTICGSPIERFLIECRK